MKFSEHKKIIKTLGKNIKSLKLPDSDRTIRTEPKNKNIFLLIIILFKKWIITPIKKKNSTI